MKVEKLSFYITVNLDYRHTLWINSRFSYELYITSRYNLESYQGINHSEIYEINLFEELKTHYHFK